MKIATVSLLVLAAVAVLALTFSPATLEAGPDGKTLFVDEGKCNLCHAVKAAAIEAKTSSDKMKGPDLSGYKPPEGFDVGAYLKQETTNAEGQKHEKTFKGSDEELQALIDWLGSLEAPKSSPQG